MLNIIKTSKYAKFNFIHNPLLLKIKFNWANNKLRLCMINMKMYEKS